jgi:muramoyltetrapeptide carboxypeptidase LdcA involved in peptidoglycan recycling
MIYPEFLSSGCKIGITAPSDGNKKDTDFIRLDSGIKKFSELGYQVVETSLVRNSTKGRSGAADLRAKELAELITNPEVKWIISAKGGDFLMEVLPYLDFKKLKQYPTWFQGYSDNTGITFTVTTNCDIATLYGCNFNDFGMTEWHKALTDNLALLEGEDVIFESFPKYEDGFFDKVTGYEGYVLEKPVYWKIITGQEEINLSGRLLGGCLDVLLNLSGTKYDNTRNFIKNYKEDGIVWYLESFALSSDALMRGLWQLREAGWFEGAKGIVFGRPAFFEENYEISYEEAVLSVLGELNLPIILDADVGHKAPQMTMINGAVAQLYSKDGKGTLKYLLK